MSVKRTGQVSCSVQWISDNFLRVKSSSVNGADTVDYTYDDDGLLIKAGVLSISRNA